MTVWAVALMSFPAAAQQAPSLPAEMHPWGKFELGAWKRMRLITETYNEQGTIASTNIADSKTTLFDMEDGTLTLETQTCVEMAGKRFESDPQMVKQGFHGEAITPSLKVKESAAGQVEIDDRKIPCQVLKLESNGNSGKTTTTIYYSASVAPHILKRESKTIDAEGKTVLSETTATLVALDMPYRIEGETHLAAHLKTVQKSPKGTITTLSWLCPDIPGGIVSHNSKEFDANGKLVRHTVLELVDYGFEPEKDRSSTFGRKRANRHRSR
jgi:hypothetical protein